uniref:Putative conserved plasma membrane protein n=1 Tax=Culex tarsalis TaxID=7177 RepID=A0A1Q3FB47_CULTA
MTNTLKSRYIEDLYNDGATKPIDADVDSYEIQLPPWYDEAKFKRGQQYYNNNRPGIVTGALCGLISVLAIPSILDVLIFTRRSSSPMTAYRRYVLTILHTTNWYDEELKPGSKSWKSLEYVRRIHAASGKQANKQNSKMMVSQKDVAITQFGFVGFVALSYPMLGINYDEAGMEGFVHFWRTIGYMLGLEDRFNICTEDLITSKQRMTLVLEQILRPALQTVSTEFVQMTNAMIDGLWCVNTFLDYNAFIFLTRRLAGVPGHYYWKDEPRNDGSTRPDYEKMGWHSRYILCMVLYINEVLLYVPIIRWYFNILFTVNAYFIDRYFPYLAMIKFGIKNAFVKVVY